MSWVAPRTYVTGEVITASILNQHIRDNLRYLKGLEGDVTFDDDIDIGANKLKLTSMFLDEGTTAWLDLRNIADSDWKSLRLGSLQFFIGLAAGANGISLDARGVNTNYLALRAFDTDGSLVEVMRLQGAADAYVQMTLPFVITPGTAPGTLVEGHTWYLAADDKLYYRDASANIELVGINAPTRGDVLYRGASNWLNLAKGSAGQVLTQGANDPAWSGQNTIVFSTAGLFNGTSPTSYTDLDLSGTVGSNQAVCLIKVFNNSGDATSQAYRFRKDDDGDGFDTSGTGGSGILSDQEAVYLLVVTDATGVVEWESNAAKTTVITMEAYLI